MNRFRPPARSKAPPNTLCQKCLKRDKSPSIEDYECTAAVQERPYKPRPSRTQQLLNPKLMPQLNSEVPNDLLRKKGIADEELAKKAHERGRKESFEAISPRLRSRSVSSNSESVSTISTNLSRSPSPRRNRSSSPRRKSRVDRDHSNRRKRRRSLSSSGYSHGGSNSEEAHKAKDRNTRKRLSSFSPAPRGRRRSRVSRSPDMEHSRSRSDSRSRRARKTRSRSLRRVRRSISGEPSRSPYRRGRETRRGYEERPLRVEERPLRVEERPPVASLSNGNGYVDPLPPRERSLSPYSKRLALTQSMSMSR